MRVGAATIVRLPIKARAANRASIQLTHRRLQLNGFYPAKSIYTCIFVLSMKDQAFIQAALSFTLQIILPLYTVVPLASHVL